MGYKFHINFHIKTSLIDYKIKANLLIDLDKY